MAPIFGPRPTTFIHAFEAVLLVSVLALSVARIIINGGIKSRADFMSLAMAAKSVVFLSYTVLSQHVQALKRWASLKAYTIINGTEIVFWAAVVFLMIQANLQRCVGSACAVSWVIVSLAICMSLLSAYALVVSWNNFRAAKHSSQAELVLESQSQSTECVRDKHAPSEKSGI